MSAAARAIEMHNFFNNFKTLGGKAFEKVLLENARQVSTPLATRMLAQMGLTESTETPFKVFENGCGVGVVAPILQHMVKPEVLKQSSILCGDFSEQLIELAKKMIEGQGWENTEARQIDAQVCGFCFHNLGSEALTSDRKLALKTAPSLTLQQTSHSTSFPTLRLH